MANFKYDGSGLNNGLSQFISKADTAIRMYAETGAQKLRSYAQENRRWTDRTSHARQRLNAYVTKMDNGYRITLAHGVDYGIWLELAHEKKYSIIPETIRVVGNEEILPGFERLIERLGKE